MELPIKSVILIAICVLVLVAVSSFFFFRVNPEIDKAKAQRTFNLACNDYAKRGCAWELTEEAGFSDFLDSCKIVFGSDKEEFSCLYSMCSECKQFEAQYTQCAGRCSRIEADLRMGIGITDTCATYLEQCPGHACQACAYS
jgi:hypothetical protein